MTSEECYFLIGLPAKVKAFAREVRKQWRIESMHWILDVTFTEDASRIRRHHDP